jgi:hypothetical protein
MVHISEMKKSGCKIIMIREDTVLPFLSLYH